jgi:alpha-amylase
MGVIMQAFYWNCPDLEAVPGAWWDRVAAEVPALAGAGFTALWLPPASKAASSTSMGYDIYDYFDLGEFDQKGAQPTWFGTRQDLEALIAVARSNHLQVYADLVLNHNSGGDGQEKNPIDGQVRWTIFNPASGRFKRNWECFHPSAYETWDAASFGDMPDLCHRNPDVYTQLLEHAEWLLTDIGFDGFRYDFVKGYGAWMARAVQELRGLDAGVGYKPFGVGECWDSERTIFDWLDEVNTWTDNPVTAFDFPLRWKLQSLCDQYGFNLADLASSGTVMRDRPAQAVTFVENHDVARSSPIVNDKMLAYAVILTHEGYPCVFWEDYYNWDLAQDGNRSGIAALVETHERFAGGATSILYADQDLYIMQRDGFGAQPGLVLVLNNRADWNGRWIQTRWTQTHLVPAAWRGRADLGVPERQMDQRRRLDGYVGAAARLRGLRPAPVTGPVGGQPASPCWVAASTKLVSIIFDGSKPFAFSLRVARSSTKA